MTKYSKGITIAKNIRILVTNKNSFKECNEEIIDELNNNSKVSKKDRLEIIEAILK